MPRALRIHATSLLLLGAALGACTRSAPEEVIKVEEPAMGCLFGSSFSELTSPDGRLVLGPQVILSEKSKRTPLVDEQIVIGMSAHGKKDVGSAAAAFALTADGGIDRHRVSDKWSPQKFTLYRFHGNKAHQGFIFKEGTKVLLALVRDDKVTDCKLSKNVGTITGTSCMFGAGPDFVERLPDRVTVSKRQMLNPETITDADAARIVAIYGALRPSPDPLTIAQVFEASYGKISRRIVTDLFTEKLYDIIEFGALAPASATTDMWSLGAIVPEGTTRTVAKSEGGTFRMCSIPPHKVDPQDYPPHLCAFGGSLESIRKNEAFTLGKTETYDASRAFTEELRIQVLGGFRVTNPGQVRSLEDAMRLAQGGQFRHTRAVMKPTAVSFDIITYERPQSPARQGFIVASGSDRVAAVIGDGLIRRCSVRGPTP